jgi:hypothetical protein
MPTVMEVLEKMKTETYTERDICLTHGPVDLFKFIYQVFDGYQMCMEQDVCNALLGLSFKIIFNFQMEFKDVVNEADDMSLDIYAALANSNIKFISCMREFISKVERECGMSKDKLKRHFNHSQLMKGFGMISNSSFVTIQDLVEDMLTGDIMELPDHKEFNLAEWIDEHFVKFKKIFDKMYPTYRKKLWKFVVDKFVLLFSQYLLINTLKY